MSLSRQERKAASVLPVPVGARIRVDSPRAIAGQPWRCGAVGPGNDARNQAAVRGWKAASAVVSLSESRAECGGSAAGAGFAGLDGLRVPGGFGLDELVGIAEVLSEQHTATWFGCMGWPPDACHRGPQPLLSSPMPARPV